MAWCRVPSPPASHHNPRYPHPRCNRYVVDLWVVVVPCALSYRCRTHPHCSPRAPRHQTACPSRQNPMQRPMVYHQPPTARYVSCGVLPSYNPVAPLLRLQGMPTSTEPSPADGAHVHTVPSGAAAHRPNTASPHNGDSKPVVLSTPPSMVCALLTRARMHSTLHVCHAQGYNGTMMPTPGAPTNTAEPSPPPQGMHT